MVQAAKLVRKKLGELLVEEGLLKEEQVQEILRRQRGSGELFGEALVKLGFLQEADIARAIVRQFGLPYLDASRYQISREAVASVPADLMWQNHFIVLDKIGKTLIIALSGILHPDVAEKLERLTASQLFVYISTNTQVNQALTKHVPHHGNGTEA